jgi:hypothetical protein
MRMQVKHCTTGGSKSAGVVIFQRQPLHPRRWPDVFRVRMVGREIKLLPVHYCRSGLALAPYSVALNGTYHFEVRPAVLNLPACLECRSLTAPLTWCLNASKRAIASSWAL